MKDLIRKILKEDLEYWSAKDNKIGVKEGENQFDNYMFFQNLKEIKENIEELLSMDPSEVDNILSDGHDWANDHISTSKDDIEEVTSFLKNSRGDMMEEKWSKKYKKSIDCNNPKGFSQKAHCQGRKKRK